MPELSFVANVEPVPKSRPRTVSVKDRAGRVRRVSTYTPKRCKDFERDLSLYAFRAISAAWDKAGPFTVRLDFYCRTARRVDLDNLCKAVLDALNGIVWNDDCDVTQLSAAKDIDRENPRVEVTVNG